MLEWTGRSGPLTWVLVPVGAGFAAVAYRLPRYLVRGQARLVAPAMSLGVAEDVIDTDPAGAKALHRRGPGPAA